MVPERHGKGKHLSGKTSTPPLVRPLEKDQRSWGENWSEPDSRAARLLTEAIGLLDIRKGKGNIAGKELARWD
jgi:hypothetical protein